VAAFQKFTPVLTGKGNPYKPFNPYQAFLELKNDTSDLFTAWKSESAQHSHMTPLNMSDIEFSRFESEQAEVIVPGEMDDIRRNVRALLAEKVKFFEEFDAVDDSSDDLDSLTDC